MKELKLVVRRLSIERPPDKTHILIWQDGKWMWHYQDSWFHQTPSNFEYWALMPGSPELSAEEQDEEDYNQWLHQGPASYNTATSIREVWLMARRTLREKLKK